MTEYETATLITRYIALAIGVGQLAVVWYGIRIMSIARERRAREQDQQHDETMAAHDETMTALQALIARSTVNRD